MKPTKRPKVPEHTVKNTRTGKITKVPKGIEPSFAYNVGKQWLKPYTPEIKKFTILGKAPNVRAFFANSTDILQAGKSVKFYTEKFLQQFGIRKIHDVATFTDKTGMDIPISKEIVTGQNMATKYKEYAPYVNLLAQTLKDPEAIYKVYDKKNQTITRKYLKHHKTKKGKPYAYSTLVWNIKTKQWEIKMVFTGKNPPQQEGLIVYQKN